MVSYNDTEECNKASINLSNLRHNYKVIKEYAGSRPLMAVVKGDAYGHGLEECAKALADEGADCLGVMDSNEGARLREAGLHSQEICVLSGMDSEQLIKEALKHNLTLFAHSYDQLANLSVLASREAQKLCIFLKIDSGMCRLGVSHGLAMDFVKKSLDYTYLEVVGLATHLATIGDHGAFQQLERFWNVCAKAQDLFKKPLLNSALSGGGLLAHPGYPDGLSRPGLVLYGVPPVIPKPSKILRLEPWKDPKLQSVRIPPFSPKPPKVGKQRWGQYRKQKPIADGHRKALKAMADLKPVMRVTSRIIQIKNIIRGSEVSYDRTFKAERDMKIAIAPIGYVHGYSVTRSGMTHALIRGQEAPQLGRICMNLSVFDISKIDRVTSGEEVVLLGASKEASIDAYLEHEGHIQNPYEVLCLYGRLNHREYV
jgi:alanine racemase